MAKRVAPMLFGRRMKRWANAWELQRGPFLFRVLEVNNPERLPFAAVVSSGANPLDWRRECNTLGAALRALRSMRNRLLGHLVDKVSR
jgi:hypothetical protein